jgi:hydrogenase maturation protein HypF
VADRHPGYRSSAWARAQPDVSLRLVQHHHAHIASALADNGHPGERPVIGFAFDGTGYGDDGAVWGGEVLVADYAGYRRVGHLRYAWLPGGDAGVRNPCRMALSQLRSAGLAWDPALPSVAACSPTERAVLARQLVSGLSCSRTSSMGRLFDAVSSLVGVCHRVAYEAEAAMLFEELAASALDGCRPRYRFDTSTAELDPRPVIIGVVRDVLAGVPAAVIAAAFHLAVTDLVVQQAQSVRVRTGLDTVALSGGVFLNAVLTELCLERLPAAGFRVLRHRLVPPSDAGLALGQVMIAARVGTRG